MANQMVVNATPLTPSYPLEMIDKCLHSMELMVKDASQYFWVKSKGNYTHNGELMTISFTSTPNLGMTKA